MKYAKQPNPEQSALEIAAEVESKASALRAICLKQLNQLSRGEE